MLKPLAKEHKLVFITDPSGSRVSQWLDVANKNGNILYIFRDQEGLKFDFFVIAGLASLELPLSEEPNLGKWTIHISADDGDAENEIKANFEVKKYVLPKFEVAINHKKKLKSTDKHVDVKVCGK